MGANGCGLTSSPAKKEFIKKYGFNAYTHDEFLQDKNIKDFSLVLNSQGGKSIKQHLQRMAPTGRLITFGISSAIKDGKRSYINFLKTVSSFFTLSLVKLMEENKGVYGLNALKLFENEEYLKSKLSILDNIPYKPHVDSTFKYIDIAKAHQYLEDRKAKGKVLIAWK